MCRLRMTDVHERRGKRVVVKAYFVGIFVTCRKFLRNNVSGIRGLMTFPYGDKALLLLPGTTAEVRSVPVA